MVVCGFHMCKQIESYGGQKMTTYAVVDYTSDSRCVSFTSKAYVFELRFGGKRDVCEPVQKLVFLSAMTRTY